MSQPPRANAHHDEDAPPRAGRSPANRLGLNYRDVPSRKVPGRIVDVHTHVNAVASVDAFFEAADLYDIETIVSMTPLDDIEKLAPHHRARLRFIAIPRWREMGNTGDFQTQWLADLETFHALGARRMKFWVAPRLRGEHGLTLRDPFFRPLIRRGMELGYAFMVHVGDPAEWFAPGGKYADVAKFGTKADQYPQLEAFLEQVAPRNVIAAHMGGSIEDPDFLQSLLDRYPHLCLDSSATKWIVRGVAARPARCREFFIHNADRILFGSDLVVAEKFDFEHYASRYWVHRMMYESGCRGESPIEDPDAVGPPQLAGLDLPHDVLHKLYQENAEKLGY